MDKRPDSPPRNGWRKKWTKGVRGDGPDRIYGYKVRFMGNKWMCFYKLTACGCNLAHTYGFHSECTKNKSKLSLPATYEFCIKSVTVTVASSM